MSLLVDNHQVMIGKDAKSNDELSLRLAHGNDYWFHVKGCAGSHVILSWHEQKGEPDKQLIEKIASLAAYHSKQRKGGVVPIIYTQAKYVKKKRGAAPGAVWVSKEKVVKVRPISPEELAGVVVE